MGQLWRFLQANPFLIFVIISVVFSIVGRTVKALNAQAEQRRLAQAKARAEMDALRTGRVERPPPVAQEVRAPAPSAREALEEMALRRQLEIAQRRAARPPRPVARANRPARPVARQAPRERPPPVVPSSGRQPRGDRGMAAAPPTGSAGRLNIPDQMSRSPEGGSRSRVAVQVQQARPQEQVQEVAAERRVSQGGPAEVVKERANARGLRPQLRRAIILQEVLMPPVSMR